MNRKKINQSDKKNIIQLSPYISLSRKAFLACPYFSQLTKATMPLSANFLSPASFRLNDRVLKTTTHWLGGIRGLFTVDK